LDDRSGAIADTVGAGSAWAILPGLDRSGQRLEEQNDRIAPSSKEDHRSREQRLYQRPVTRRP
jgi:hypothetical protein